MIYVTPPCYSMSGYWSLDKEEKAYPPKRFPAGDNVDRRALDKAERYDSGEVEEKAYFVLSSWESHHT